MEPQSEIFQTIFSSLKNLRKVIWALVIVFVFSLFVAGGTIRDENGNLAAVATIQKVLFLPFNETLEPGSALDIGVPGTNITVRITVKSVSANKTVLSVEQVDQ